MSHDAHHPETQIQPRPSPGRGATRSVVVVDADPLARRATRDAIEEDEGLVVVGEADTVDAAVRICGAGRPDAVIVEPDMAGDRGHRLIEALCATPSPPLVVVFSHQTGDDELLSSLRAGAAGFVSKASGTEALVAAVHATLRHEVAISRTDTRRIIELLRSARLRTHGMRPVRSSLTPREWEILELMADGASTRQMADRLVVSESTIYSHVKSILRKLGVHSRAEAVAAMASLKASEDRRQNG